LHNAANRSDETTKSAAKCGQIYGGPGLEWRAPAADPKANITNWYYTTFLEASFRAAKYDWARFDDIRNLLRPASQKMPFASSIRSRFSTRSDAKLATG
jgi:hypothetical protein